MRATVEYIQARFDSYNEQFFGGSLPPIPIRLSHAKGFLGKVTFTRRRKGLFQKYKNEDFVLRINVRIDLPEEVVEDTILHEMIHIYVNSVGNNGTRRYREGHGKLWTQTAKLAQQLYGHDLGNIQRYSTKEEQQKFKHYHDMKATKSLVNAYLVKLISGDLVPLKNLTPDQLAELQGMNIIGIYQVKPKIQQVLGKRVTRFISWETLLDCIENGIDYETEEVCGHLRIKIGEDTDTVWLKHRR